MLNQKRLRSLPSRRRLILSLTVLVSFWAYGDSAPAQDSENAAPSSMPNILWLTTEDIGPQLGCYGDAVATTPNLDAFAAKSLLYKTAWSNYPVCAPARTTIISGRYACSDGAGNMRCDAPLPETFRSLPEYLREQGYYCTNNAKTDYNYNNLQEIWDESSKEAHWRNRPDDKPFFAVFNQTCTHESRLRKRPHKAVIDPQSVELAPYWPDTAKVRQDWAQYYDKITKMDQWFAGHLRDLEKAGLADDTIVLFFGDHGSGMPRHKRYAGDSGMRVPFILHVPEKYKALMPDDYSPGQASERLVSFVDLAPTMLSIIGRQPESHMQGQVLAGEFESAPPEFLFGFRERMDERPDLSHVIRDRRYVLSVHFRTDLIHGQYLDYQQQTPTTSTWNFLFDSGKLNETQARFWSPRPSVEMFDLLADPFETRNLANEPLLQETRTRLLDALRDNTLDCNVQSMMPEPWQFEKFGLDQARTLDPVHMAAVYSAAMEAIRTHETGFPDDVLDTLRINAASDSGAIRYWAAQSAWNLCGSDDEQHSAAAIEVSRRLATDDQNCVRISALKTLAHFDGDGPDEPIAQLIELSNQKISGYYGAVAALNALDTLRDRLNDQQRKEIRSFESKPSGIRRGNNYIERLQSRFGS